MPESRKPRASQTVGHYQIEKTLGRGSVGTVYLARDSRIGRPVALKMVELETVRFEDDLETAEFFQRLQREVEVCGRLNHPNLVTLYDVGYENHRVSYLAMELMDGPSLLDLIKSRKPDPVPVGEVLTIATHVLSGLAHAHAQGIVHRDIKPANILLTKNHVAKIADFGIARPAESSMTVAGTLMGTPNYMSPEQVRGELATPRSDLFSFGAVLYELLTSRKPFAAPDISGVLYKVVGQPHPPITSSSVPLRLAKLIDRLLEKSPDARPDSADEVLAEIREIESGVDTQNEITPIDTGSLVEDMSPDDEISEAAGRPSETSPPSAKGLSGLTERAIPAALFWTVIVVWTGGLGAIALSIALQIDSSPTVTIPEETLLEFAAKKEAMVEAERLCAEARFDECIAAYDAYLERYPYASAASAGRAEAMRLRASVRKGDDEEESRSAWRRFTGGVKRVFGKD